MYDYLIVGAGLFGATFAHQATKAGKRCLVIDKRGHVGGNLYCEDIAGINVHSYGAHIFHTSDKEIWDFVNAIVPFYSYFHAPLASAADGKLYNLPFNMNTFEQLWGVCTPHEAMEMFETQRRKAIARMNADGVIEPRNLEEQALTLVGEDIYKLLILHYTEKQWGRPCRELPAFIIRRIPLRFTFDNNYYDDIFQGIPMGGYNVLFDRLLEDSEVKTGVDFNGIKDRWRSMASNLIYTGPIDEYFDFKLGRLDWRTVRFDIETLDIPNFQGNAVVNYTDSATPWTRIIEHKHFEMFGHDIYKNPRTVISREYAMEFRPGLEPYYPINDHRNNELAQRYREMAREEQDVYFGGRLAEYKYYDMAPVVQQALRLWKKLSR